MDGEVSDAEFWNALNCYEMNQAVGQMGDDMDDEGEGFCADVRRLVPRCEMATVDEPGLYQGRQRKSPVQRHRSQTEIRWAPMA